MPADLTRNAAVGHTDIPGMRHLTVAAALVVATGIAAAPSVAAEPAEPTTPAPTSTAPAEPTTPAPTSSAPTSTEPTSSAPAEPAGAREVTYRVTTTSDLTANIYYVTGDPPSQAEANDPKFMPMARTLVGPGAPWTFQATLNDPNQWAFVSASGGLRVNPEFRCEIAVDGEVVVSQQGGSGVQCSLRPW